MRWLIIIIAAVVLLYVRSLFNKRIDGSEHRKATKNELPLWDGLCLKFQKYLDFTQKSILSNKMEIANQKGELFTFQKVVTNIIVSYKLNGKVEKSWKFPFGVALNTAFNSIDDYYASIKEIKVYEEPGVTSVYSIGDKYGLWNSGYTTPLKAKKLTDAIYDAIDDKYVYARGWNRLIKVQMNGLYGIINLHGQTMLECRYTSIEAQNIIDDYTTAIFNDLAVFEEYHVKSDLLEEWIKENTTNNELSTSSAIKNAFNSISCRDSFIVIKNGKFGVVSYYDVEIIPFEYDAIEWVNDYLYIAVKNGKYGVIWIGNKVVIPFFYNHIVTLGIDMFGTLESGLKSQLFRVQDEHSNDAVINGLGEIIIPFMAPHLLEQKMYSLFY